MSGNNSKVTKPDKLTDKAFSRLMLTSILGILMCLTCLCSATWAWYSSNIASSSNTVASGQFDLVVTVQSAEAIVNASESEPLSVVDNGLGAKVCNIKDAGSYNVTLKISEDTTVTKGFCVVKINGVSYKTDLITVDDTENFVFTLVTNAPDVSVSFSPAWGIPAESQILKKGTLTIAAE